MSRNARQEKIVELINAYAISTQEELAENLIKSGFPVTQATISRDIKDLGLIKTTNEQNVYRYITAKALDYKISGKLINVFKDSVLSIVNANNLIVVKTLAGSANTAAMVLDQLNFSEMIGTIAGDDTLLLITATNDDAIIVKDKLERIIN